MGQLAVVRLVYSEGWRLLCEQLTPAFPNYLRVGGWLVGSVCASAFDTPTTVKAHWVQQMCRIARKCGLSENNTKKQQILRHFSYQSEEPAVSLRYLSKFRWQPTLKGFHVVDISCSALRCIDSAAHPHHPGCIARMHSLCSFPNRVFQPISRL